ncbi:MAG: glutamine-synthetase adenylyltransferase [Bryobacterales bacterium]|nr:glutamine-synthetase adenylyltransferase [Bryobacterales bacterium]
MVTLLRVSPEPDAAVHFLRRLYDEQPFPFQRLVRSPATVQFLLTVFAQSRFLSEEVLRAPEWIEPLAHAGNLQQQMTADEYISRLTARLARFPAGEVPVGEFAAFRREQVLRILLRDLHGYAPLPEVAEELSHLADAIVECAWRRVYASLAARHGVPAHAETGLECGMSVIAVGKLGGSELNYSSDIDLLFVHGGAGETTGPAVIANQDFFKRACQQLVDLLSAFTPHGAAYRVDLRLRPDGAQGELCLSLTAARQYYSKRARDWELQMLIKARVAAGDPEPGRQLLEFVEPLIYSSSTDFSKVEAVSVARTRIHERLEQRKRGKDKAELDVKLAPGGIRDIEFLVQCLQRLHGGREGWVRHGGTILALGRLRDKNLISEIEYGRLAPAYVFLRNLEHRLQFQEDRQTHTLATDDAGELEALARRMPPATLGARVSGENLLAELTRHLANVSEIYDRVVRAQLPTAAAAPVPTAPIPPLAAGAADAIDALFPNLARQLAQRAPAFAATLSRSRLRYGVRAFEHFLERLLHHPDWLKRFDADPVLAGYAVDLFEHSPFFAEQLNRKPELVEELMKVREEPQGRREYARLASTFSGPADLRRFFNREMLRIQADSICLRRPVWDTLKWTSDLADCAISAAYGMALEQAVRTQPPASPHYRPRQQMMVIALGRLGMREFDLASDADLVFILEDRDAPERVFWTRVAERLIEILTAYTGDGTLFAADTRLRPNGREGPLVQTETAFRDYFARSAEAWEGITYLKARLIVGDETQGHQFLNELQDLDWQRYGQTERSRLPLREMRLRLEQEQGRDHPLKAARGGYYDIDFALLYLRLKSAGIFFKVLNTPERIDVIHKMGHLDRADARFLLDAATLYRAADHALRLTSGQAEGKLPAAQLQLQMIEELTGRWTPEHLHDQPLVDELEQIRARTRDYFLRLFA